MNSNNNQFRNNSRTILKIAKREHKTATCGKFDQRFHLVAEKVSFLLTRYVPYKNTLFRTKSGLPSPLTHTHTHTHFITLIHRRAKYCIQLIPDAIGLYLIYMTVQFIKSISHNFEFPSGYVSTTREVTETLSVTSPRPPVYE